MAYRAATTPFGRTLQRAVPAVPSVAAASAPAPAFAAAAAAIVPDWRRQPLLRHFPQNLHARSYPQPPHAQRQAGGGAVLPRSGLVRSGPVLLGGVSLLTASLVAGNTPRGAAAAMSTDAASAAASGAAPSPSGTIVVYVTVPSVEVAESLGSKFVESRLAACVNVLPGVTSIYSWKGKIEKDPELLLIIKTRQELLQQLTAFVRANHPYEEPEVIGLPILGGSPSYLQWLLDNTGPGPQQAEQPRAE